MPALGSLSPQTQPLRLQGRAGQESTGKNALGAGERLQACGPAQDTAQQTWGTATSRQGRGDGTEASVTEERALRGSEPHPPAGTPHSGSESPGLFQDGSRTPCSRRQAGARCPWGNRRGMTRSDPFKRQKRAIRLSLAKVAFQTGERRRHNQYSC